MTALRTIALAAAVLALAGWTAPDGNDDLAGVQAAIQHYFDGQATGDPQVMARAFHPGARLIWIQDGAVTTRELADWLAGFSGQPAADESQRKRRIVSMDVSGDVAVAKLELDYPAVLFTDYMTLHKVGGEWKIVHKSFTRTARAAS